MGSAAYLILEDGTLLKGESVGSRREVISEIVFNTSMTGYLEVLTDPLSLETMASALRIWSLQDPGCPLSSPGNSPVFLLTSARKTPSRIFSQDMIFPEFQALIPER